MQIDAGTAIAIISFVGSMIVGFGAWMFRIDRGISSVRVVIEDIRELKADNDKEHEQFRNKIDHHAERIVSLEAYRRTK